MIGDTSGRTTERSLKTTEVVKGYANQIEQQLAGLLNFDTGDNAAVARNNHDWLSEITFIDFLRDVGKHFSVNYMLAKDSVSARIEEGISLFPYTTLFRSSFDFFKLYEQENVTLQIGGSDQWGNITAGMEFIRRSREDQSKEIKVYGLTVPLITKADGTKFGKTAGGAVWLEPDKTTPYEFYQFWINTDDRDVVKFLKYFTFLDQEELDKLQTEVDNNPGDRVAQRRLAEEMTMLVHGHDALDQAQKISATLFSVDLTRLSASDNELGFLVVHTYEYV